MCHQITPRCEVAQGLVGAAAPCSGSSTRASCVERRSMFRTRCVQYLLSIGSVESFNKSVLHGASRPDEASLDAVLFSPFLQRLANGFWALVHAQRERLAADFDGFLQRPHDTYRRQAGVDLDPQRFRVEVIHDVEGAEAPTRAAELVSNARRTDLAQGRCSSRSHHRAVQNPQ